MLYLAVHMPKSAESIDLTNLPKAQHPYRCNQNMVINVTLKDDPIQQFDQFLSFVAHRDWCTNDPQAWDLLFH